MLGLKLNHVSKRGHRALHYLCGYNYSSVPWLGRPPLLLIWGLGNSLARRETVYPQIPQNVPCSLLDIFWKFHENQSMRLRLKKKSMHCKSNILDSPPHSSICPSVHLNNSSVFLLCFNNMWDTCQHSGQSGCLQLLYHRKITTGFC